MALYYHVFIIKIDKAKKKLEPIERDKH